MDESYPIELQMKWEKYKSGNWQGLTTQEIGRRSRYEQMD
jgi:hypothetical protein